MTTPPPDGDPQEIIERISGLARGPKGEQGAEGKQGLRGDLPPELRRALVYLFLAAVLIAVLALGGVFYALDRSAEQNRAAIRANDHKFCAVVGAATATPVSRPSDPEANPSREANYSFYVKFVRLRHSLGCD